MPIPVSERTALLVEAEPPTNSRTIFVRIANFTKSREFIKLKGWFTVLLDHLIMIPFIPVILARMPFEGSDLDWGLRPAAFLVMGLVPLGILLAIIWAFGPVLIFFLAWFAFHKALRLIETLYKTRCGRRAVRTVAAAAMAFGLWYSADFRQRWTPLDLPPLDVSTSSIRLLEVQPAGPRWRIEAELRTVRLEDNPAYEALSYEWGNQSRTHSISVGGKRFGVTKNLWEALHNIRHLTEPRVLWVDAVCIDQENTKEKDSQVPLMSLIYQRARRVLVSLGKHVPPRWVAQSDPAAWPSGWAMERAGEYWGSTHYWLEQLALEEYWKRCWVVQEVGVALAIDVYAGRQVIPWAKFTKLMLLYAQKLPSSPLPGRVLRFDELRRAMYHDGETYELSYLLNSFRDSFCSVNLDKIIAFTGMAVDCRGECLPVDYAGGIKPLYEAAISFQNSSSSPDADSAVEMVYFAALVRRLLTRQQREVDREYVKPGWMYQPESWAYYWCGDDAIEFCTMGPEVMLLFPILEHLRAPLSASKPLSVRSSTWLPSAAEAKDAWAPDPDTSLADIVVRGVIAGEVRELGPTYADYLRYPRVSQEWSARLSARYPAESDQRRARGLNARLSALLGSAADFRLADVTPLPGIEGSRPESTGAGDTGARLFLGGRDMIMGLAPSNARVGDRLCQFWNSSAVAILRDGEDGGYDVIGRGTMLRYGDEVDWDVPMNKGAFFPGSAETVDLQINLATLNHLSFDVVNLPGFQ